MNASEFEEVLFRKVEGRDWESFDDVEVPLVPTMALEASLSRLRLGAEFLRGFEDQVERHGFHVADRAVSRLFGQPLSIFEVLAYPEFPLTLRLDLVRAARTPFLLAGRTWSRYPDLEYEVGLFMLFDHLCEDFTDPITLQDSDIPEGEFRRRPVLHLSGDNKVVHDLIFEGLSELLRHPDGWVQDCALHGLGHSRHPLASKTVQGYLDKIDPASSPELLTWISRCRDGTVD